MGINYNEYPDKLPIGFKASVLKRLMPSSELILRASPTQKRDLLARKLELEKAIAEEPVRFFTPNAGSQFDFMTESAERLRGKYFLAGNKSGKSTAAAIMAGEYATGQLLWGRDFRQPLQLPFPVPNRGVYYADDFDAHKQTTIPTLFTWLPRRFIRDADRNSAGYLTDLYLTNGSVINFKTYDQGYEKAEGKDWMWAVCDEPPKRDLYTGIRRGLVVYDGILVIAATLLSEPWLWDEIEQTSVQVYSASIYDNRWIPASSRDEFVAGLTHEEREVRVHGRPVTLSGLVYKEFRDDAPWVVPVQHRYHDPVSEAPWPVILGVDPHERIPIHLLWFWLTPSNGLIAFDFALIPNRSITDIFADIERIEKRHDQPTKLVIMDPNAGRRTQMGGRSWLDEFGEHGFDVALGDDNLDMGHADVNEMLRVGEVNGVPRPPRLTFQESCRGKGGPVHALTRYAWDDWSRANRMLRTPKETVREQYKHFPDIIRYACRGVASGRLDFKVLADQEFHESIHIMTQPPIGRGFYN